MLSLTPTVSEHPPSRCQRHFVVPSSSLRADHRLLSPTFSQIGEFVKVNLEYFPGSHRRMFQRACLKVSTFLPIRFGPYYKYLPPLPTLTETFFTTNHYNVLQAFCHPRPRVFLSRIPGHLPRGVPELDDGWPSVRYMETREHRPKDLRRLSHQRGKPASRPRHPRH